MCFSFLSQEEVSSDLVSDSEPDSDSELSDDFEQSRLCSLRQSQSYSNSGNTAILDKTKSKFWDKCSHDVTGACVTIGAVLLIFLIVHIIAL